MVKYEMVNYGFYHTPVGKGMAAWDEEGVCLISFPGESVEGFTDRLMTKYGDIREGTGEILSELEAYFAGEKKHFDAKPVYHGTSFQEQVWMGLISIPYGETLTYSELAAAIGKPKAARAVGSACGRNPLPLLIPCHRVVASEGLGGFGGGLAMKSWLLRLEKENKSRIES